MRKDILGPALVVTLFLLSACASLAAEDLVYEQVSGDQRIEYLESRTAEGDGYAVTLQGAGEKSESRLGSDLSTLSWTIERPSDSTRVSFVREGRTIKAEGSFKGKPFRKSYGIDDDPWIEFHELGMDNFAGQSRNEMSFWTIDRRNMSIVKFKAQKQGVDLVEIAGTRQKAIKVRLSLTGILSVLGWHAAFWLREDDGRYLRLDAPGLTPADHASVVTLIRESR